jgi:hypothetical protein
MPGGYDFNQIFSILCLFVSNIIVIRSGAQCRVRGRSFVCASDPILLDDAMLSGGKLGRKRI